MIVDIRKLTLHQLRVFAAVARHCSFTRAAGELSLTQAAVSAQIRNLGDLVGIPLLEQFGKKIHVTAAGRRLLEHAGRMEAVVKEISRDFTAYREEGAGSVRVGASTSIGTYFFPALIACFSSRFPRVEVSLEIENTAHVEKRLLADDFDIAYLGAAVTTPRLAATSFRQEEIFFASAPDDPLAALRAPPLERLASSRLIVREPGSATRRTMEEHCQACGISFTDVVQLGSVEAIKQAVMAGLGISYFSELTVRHELASGRLVRLDLDGFSVARTFLEVLHRDKKEPPALRAFRKFAREFSKERERDR